MLVFDATPLIYLATVGRLDLVELVTGDCVVPRSVYDEVVTAGVEAGHPDARRVERAVERGILSVCTVDDAELAEGLRRNPNASEADVDVIALAAAEDGVAVMDDKYGRAVAETEGVETRGTVFLLVSAVRDGHLSAEDARVLVDEMIDAGWYCSPDLYTRIVRELESLG